MNRTGDDLFFSSVPVFSRFEGVVDSRNYVPLPDDWFLALADVVGSTAAIAEGRYKSVNMAGASVITGVLNALDRQDLPFIFGGDGAMVALPAVEAAKAGEALASIRNWVASELGLDLRVALVPIHDIHDAGFDVTVARFATNKHVTFAMFSGGGAHWAEAQMKAGQYHIEKSSTDRRPDLSGLSCRWSPISSQNGTIASIIVRAVSTAGMEEFGHLVETIVAIAGERDRDGHPVPFRGPDLSFSTEGIHKEVRTAERRRKRPYRYLVISLQIFLTAVLDRLNLRLGRFDARAYRRQVSANSDFRKFDDGLKMTVDIDAGRLERIKAILSDAEQKGICRYGIHSQDSALMTCFVVTPMSHNHIHFIDGADGGYAQAATQLGEKRLPET